MKKIYLLLICSFIFNAAFSQSRMSDSVLYSKAKPRGVFDYGLRASGNLIGANQLGYDHVRLGFSVGGWLHKPLMQHIDLQGELLFNKEGFDYVNYFPKLGINTMRFNLYYLNINVLLKWHISDNWGFLAGLGMDRLLYSHGKFVEPFPDSVTWVSDVTYHNPNRMPVSFTIGGFYEINDRWEVDLRYRRMFASLTDKTAVRYYFLALGVAYELKK